MSRFKPPSYFMDAMKPVVAQIELKRKLAFSFSSYTLFLDEPKAGRPTPLVYGPSGSGKTFGVELCCQASNLPYTVIGSGEVSAAGYKGITLRDLLAQHFIQWGRSEGVIFMDEIDKWMRGAMRANDGEQLAMGMNKMGEMLRYVEHQDVHLQDEAKDIARLRLPDPDMPEDGDPEIWWLPARYETRKAMWVLCGAFDSLHLYIKRRLDMETLMDESILWEKAAPMDFRLYGMLPELVNRCDVMAWVKPLKGHEIIEILEQQELPRLHLMFEAIGCRLELDAGALAIAAHLAVTEKTGARGAVLRLRHVVSDCYTEADMNHLASCKIDAYVMTTGHLDLTDQKQAATLHQINSPAPEPVPSTVVPLRRRRAS